VRDAVTGAADELQSCAAKFVKENRLPGASVGVVCGQDLAWYAGVGFADLATERPPDARTPYQVASITKTFTGTAVMRLVQDGRLRLDDPVVAHVPELRDADSQTSPIEALTIRQLLSHESGLLSEPPGTDWAALAYEASAARTLKRVAEIGVKVPANSQLKYSNLGYQLLGEIVSRVSGEPYAQHVRRTILDPLGMTGSGFWPLGDELSASRATGYQPRVFTDQLDVADQMPTAGAEGGLWSCVGDLARWLATQLDAHQEAQSPDEGADLGGGRVLSAALLRAMHKPRYLSDDTWTTAWGISWYAVRRDDIVWVQHSGDLPGFAANVCFDPRSGVGAIALLNSTSDAASLAMDLAAIARRSVLAAPVRIEAPAPTPGAYRPLLGYYAIAHAGMFIRLEWRDGKLTFVDPDNPPWRPTLAPTSDPDVFVVEPGCRQAGEQVRFTRLADGRVCSVMLTAMTLQRLERVS
jgi:CubicO group peptidase (beta-lactamase class C family)